MAAQLPPWLNVSPSDFVRAAAEGAGVGIRAQSQRASEREAADRLRLAYDQLASQERRESERVAAEQQMQMNRLAVQMQQADAAEQLRRDQLASLEGYRQQRLGQYETEEDRRRGELELKSGAAAALQDYRTQRLGQYQQALDISADKARAAVARGEGEFFTDPSAPGQVFFRQPTGHVMKVVGQPSTPRVTLDEYGVPKGYSGPITDPTLRTIMGTNAPAFMQPPTPLDTTGTSIAPPLPSGEGTIALPPWGLNPPSAGTESTEAIRLTEDGRKAVFDAATKQFLRYADEDGQ